MSDFKAKMHQIRFRLGLRPHWGSLQRSPDPLAGLLLREWRKGKGQGGEGSGWDGKGGEGREEVGAPFDFLPPGATDLVTALYYTDDYAIDRWQLSSMHIDRLSKIIPYSKWHNCSLFFPLCASLPARLFLIYRCFDLLMCFFSVFRSGVTLNWLCCMPISKWFLQGKRVTVRLLFL